jgi:hypothetical protein
MSKQHVLIVYTLCFFVFFFLSPRYEKTYAAVVINEVYPKPSDEQSEWIELYNAGDESVSLNLWKIEQLGGAKASFVLNASNIISPKKYLIIPRSQSSISLSNDGDAIVLIDPQGTKVDEQSFPGILGYNTSAGRATDGTGVFTTCTQATPDGPNICPQPTPTPSETPPPTPTITPQITLEPTSIPTAQISDQKNTETAAQPQQTTVPLAPTLTIPSTDSDTFVFTMSKITAIQIAIVGISWALLVLFWYIQKKRRSKKNQKHQSTTQQM